MPDLFKPRNLSEPRHPQFKSLMESDLHGRVRDNMNNLYAEMEDPNGSFAKDFQGRSFHARMFELACFAYLRSANLEVQRDHLSPDFIVSDGKLEVAIEATTTNPSQEDSPDISIEHVETFDPSDDSKDFDWHVSKDFPWRTLASLKGKLKKNYHALPHVAGKPIVLLIAPFSEPGSVFNPDFALLPALYPTEPDSPTKPFFWLSRARTISAVAYCNSFTVPKFWRLAEQGHSTDQYVAIRTGRVLRGDDPVPWAFRHKLGHEATPIETWSEGVTLFLNPHASAPLPPDFLPASCRYISDDEGVEPHVSSFHPLSSRTRILLRSSTHPSAVSISPLSV